LRDAGNYIAKLPKREHSSPEWQAANAHFRRFAHYEHRVDRRWISNEQVRAASVGGLFSFLIRKENGPS
jgi:hypothetical protein